MIKHIPTKDGFYSIFQMGDVYRVNPLELFRTHHVNMCLNIKMDILAMKKIPFSFMLLDVLLKTGIENWICNKKEIFESDLSVDFIKVLEAKSKKEQVRLLRGSSLTTNQLIKWVFIAWEKYGLKFSQFHIEHLSKDIPENEMPVIVDVSGDKVKKVGKTTLSDKQLRHAMEFRKVVVAKFLEHDDEWHCLFLTYDSIKGKESWKDGQPHFHYISDKFGISREEVENQLRGKKYNLGSLPHIDLLKYR